MMKRKYIISLIMIFIVLTFGSCVSRKKMTYLRYAEKYGKYENVNPPIASTMPSAYKIMPYDNLYIRVITPDPQWSELFNIMPVGQGGTMTEESAGLFGYSVDTNGKIEIPFVGKVDVGNKTLSEIKTELDSIFKYYVTDAGITVRLVNNYVSIIGEVNVPGRYRMTKDCVNIFEAISMAGDVTEYGDRNKIQLIRPSPYGPVIKELSLADRSILSSEYYYIMPNDIIYALPTRGRSYQVNSSVYSLFFTTLTSALGIIAFFRTL